MAYVIMLVLGFIGGALVVFFISMPARGKLAIEKQRLAANQRRLQETSDAARKQQETLEAREEDFRRRRTAFENRLVAYEELDQENAILKRDLQNIDVNLRKVELDRDLQRERQEAIDTRVRELGSRYLKESTKWIGRSLTSNNFAACKKRMIDVIERCCGIGFDISTDEEASLLAELKADFEKAVRTEFERQEQARIKAQIREEQKLEREIERELKQLERERVAIQAALEKALADTRSDHSEEIQRLRERLAEAEAKSERAISQAQLTKSGHVYVISNIGSFGESVFKIGMTRRLEPQDRIKELGNASVPFAYDVHMMISCDDAPSLENALHRSLHHDRINKVNPRKEFFRSDIESIRQIVQANHGEIQYVADAEALEYRQSLDMLDEDVDYIEEVYDSISEEKDAVLDED
ncbi:MAG: GIY-YIG nuclease family protein [Phycisphaeraceae bacterium]